MRVSMKSDYALRAMIELAGSFGVGLVQTADIASRRGIPESYLEQLLTALRRAGLVNSIRGPQGGHSLATHPSRISAADVVRAVDGPLVTLERSAGADRARSELEASLDGLWDEVREAVTAVLEGISIEDLAARQMARLGGSMYHI